jgi:hypothetical protein
MVLFFMIVTVSDSQKDLISTRVNLHFTTGGYFIDLCKRDG